jgi:disulfide bond formation protein DsbB
MTPATVETFYGILALAAVVVIAVVVGSRAFATASQGAADVHDAIARAVRPNALGLAFVVAALATAGSLYFSEVAHFEPCLLCWYQRIAMYPLVVILGLGAVRRDRAAAVYAGVLAAIGMVLSAYHVALEWFPALSTGACDPSNPCTLIWFRVFGFISLPTLAFIAFGLILTILTLRPRAATSDRESA